MSLYLFLLRLWGSLLAIAAMPGFLRYNRYRKELEQIHHNKIKNMHFVYLEKGFLVICKKSDTSLFFYWYRLKIIICYKVYTITKQLYSRINSGL